MTRLARSLAVLAAILCAPSLGRAQQLPSLGVAGVSPATSGNQATEIASLAAIQQRALLFTDASGQSVAASAGFTTTIHDLGASPAYSKINTAVFSSQAATMALQACSDSACSASVYAVGVQSVGPGPATLSAPVFTRYWRVSVTMGSTAGTVSISSSQTAN